MGLENLVSKGILARVRRAVRIVSGRRTAQGPVAPTLADPIRFPYGPFKCKVKNPSLAPYTLFSSTDLINWEILAQSHAKFGSEDEYVDSAAPNFSHRFYHVAAEGLAASNVIGYCAVTLAPGFTLISNPFKDGNCIVAEAFKGWPDSTTVNKFEVMLMRLSENILKDGKWANPNQQLGPGEGAIFFNPTDDYKRHSFAGEVAQGSFTLPIPAGFSLRSPMVPKHGKLDEDLQFPISSGDVVHLFDSERQKYVIYPFEDGKWAAGQPILGMGEAFWVAKAEAGNWENDLVVEF
jgi:hypothetical protein